MSSKISSESQFKKNDTDYNESGFWKVVAKVSPSIAQTAFELYFVMKEPSTTLSAKATIVAALGYLICPIDPIPDVIPVVGWTDDAGALAIAYHKVKSHVTDEIKNKVDHKLSVQSCKELEA